MRRQPRGGIFVSALEKAFWLGAAGVGVASVLLIRAGLWEALSAACVALGSVLMCVVLFRELRSRAVPRWLGWVAVALALSGAALMLSKAPLERRRLVSLIDACTVGADEAACRAAWAECEVRRFHGWTVPEGCEGLTPPKWAR